MTRAVTFAVIVVALLMPAGLFAGGTDEAPQASSAVADADKTPEYGGTFTISAGASEPPSPDINDAHHASLFWLEPMQERPIHGDLETYGPRGNGEYAFQLVAFIPAKYQSGHLITDWEITTEKLVWTVRPGINWQAIDGVMDARPLTADDIVADINRFRESPWGGRFDGLVADVFADGDQVVIVYDNFSPEVFYFLGYEDRAIISPPETTAAGASKWENQGGTGPFTFEEYVVGSHMSYVKNPEYWDTTTIDGVEYEMPFIDRLFRVIIPDVSTGIAALRTGKIDLYRNVPNTQWETLERTSPDLERNQYGDMAQVISLKNSEPPFDDVDVRRALMIGTNMDVFRRFGQAEDFPAHVFPAWPGNPGVYTPLDELPADVKELYQYDAAKAKRMLADAGYPNGFEMDFHVSSEDVISMDFAALLQHEWEKIGVKVNIVAQDYVTYRQYRDTFTYSDGILVGTQIGNATGSVINLLKTDGWLNYSKYSNPRVDELSDRIAAEMDPVQQDALIKEAALIAAREVSNIGVYLIPQGYYWWPWVRNYFGEVSIEDGEFGGILPYIWIDQDLKQEMGY